MHSISKLMLAGAAAAGLAACGSEPAPESQTPETADAAPAFQSVTSTAVLMRGPVTAAAFDYWQSVSVIIDADGEHENYPADEAEWELVWSAGLALAEFANLMHVPPHNRGGVEWTRMVDEFVEIGLEAARIAEAQDYLGVLEYGETILNACEGCHQTFAPATPDI